MSHFGFISVPAPGPGTPSRRWFGVTQFQVAEQLRAKLTPILCPRRLVDSPADWRPGSLKRLFA